MKNKMTIEEALDYAARTLEFLVELPDSDTIDCCNSREVIKIIRNMAEEPVEKIDETILKDCPNCGSRNGLHSTCTKCGKRYVGGFPGGKPLREGLTTYTLTRKLKIVEVKSYVRFHEVE